MSIIGFSHIVYETENFNISKKFFSNHGFYIKKKLIEDVPNQKKLILRNNPSKVDLIYLKNLKEKTIGLEIISHNNKKKQKLKNEFLYGIGSNKNKNVEFYGEGGEGLVKFSTKSSSQHIFLPVINHSVSEKFYLKKLKFQKKVTPKYISQFIKKKYLSKTSISTLYIPNVLNKSWNVNLHIFKVGQNKYKIKLNDIGFSCMCFLIKDRNNYFFDKNANLIGPFIHKNKQDKFETGFIRDPDGFLIEYFLKYI